MVHIKPILVSVIIPVYNGSMYILDALQSVFEQSYQNLECIVIDDGSTDKTAEIVKRWIKSKNDVRFIYFYQENCGLSAARNAGIRIAKGDFYQFLDADDVILSQKLSKQIDEIPSDSIDMKIVSYTDYETGCSSDIWTPFPYYKSPKFNSQSYFAELIIRWEETMSIPPNCFLFSSNLFREEGVLFDTNLKNHEDFDCWLKILFLKPLVRYCDEKLCIYRITEGSMSKNSKLMGEGFLKVINKHLASGNYTEEEKRLLLEKGRITKIRYGRYDLMDSREKIRSWNPILRYYTKRIVQKLGFIP